MADGAGEAGHIEDTRLAGALGERYLAYALSTIVSRSLPDVRDGLKPVHRRVLYAMQQLKLDPASAFKKCARVVGDVIGKFHPHGEASVYEALVRLAQDFASRYPLVEGQGNFGNIDGDGAAAMRYTESRMTAVASAMLAGLVEDAVDFRPNYTNEEEEPVVLPAAFPNLLANGAAGIAVGMATSIPPHNAGELCAAALLLIENPEASTRELMEHVKGPDFPTGGVLVEERATMEAAYEIGRGGFRLRARWRREELRHGTWQIVIDEIPYQVQKSRLMEQVAELLEAKKLPLLADIRDESTEIVRVVLEPKSRSVDAAMLMETMFRATALETRFPLNMNVLDATRTPMVMGLRDALRAWIDHRHEVLVRRSRHRLAAARRRLEILDGYLKVFLDLDEVIRIIRVEDEPREAMMAAFGISELQAEAILNMRLRSLRRLEEMQLRDEHAALVREVAELDALLDDPRRRAKRLASEIEKTRREFSAGKIGARRTTIGEVPAAVAIDEDALAEREPITVILSRKGWMRAVRGHLADTTELKFKGGDELRLTLACETIDRLCLFASNGRFYTLRAGDLPRGRSDGQPVRLIAEMGQNDEVVSLFVHRPERQYLVAGSGGRGFVVAAEDLLAEKRTGKQVLNLRADETALLCVPAAGDHLAVVGENRKLLVFPLDEVPRLARGMGVALQKYRDGGLRDAQVFAIGDGLSWKLGDRVRNETRLEEWMGSRGQAGKMPPSGFPKSGRFG